MSQINTIWVVNHAGHNIKPAMQYSPRAVEYLTEGNVNLSEVDRMKYNLSERLRAFDHNTDAVLLCGHMLINIMVMLLLFSRYRVPFVRILIWDGRKRFYYLKDLDLEGLDKLSVPRETS